MAGENDGGTQAAAQQQTSGQADAQQQQQAGQDQQANAGVGKHAKTDDDGNPVVNDNGGAAEGKHAADGAYQAAIKQRDAKIAELEAQIAKAAETKESADKLTAEIANLKQQSGTTGLEPAGASGKDDSMLKRWERIAGLEDDE